MAEPKCRGRSHSAARRGPKATHLTFISIGRRQIEPPPPAQVHDIYSLHSPRQHLRRPRRDAKAPQYLGPHGAPSCVPFATAVFAGGQEANVAVVLGEHFRESFVATPGGRVVAQRPATSKFNSLGLQIRHWPSGRKGPELRAGGAQMQIQPSEHFRPAKAAAQTEPEPSGGRAKVQNSKSRSIK